MLERCPSFWPAREMHKVFESCTSNIAKALKPQSNNWSRSATVMLLNQFWMHMSMVQIMFMNLSIMSRKFIENATSKDKSREVRPCCHPHGSRHSTAMPCGLAGCVDAQPNERVENSAKHLTCIVTMISTTSGIPESPQVQGMHTNELDVTIPGWIH